MQVPTESDAFPKTPLPIRQILPHIPLRPLLFSSSSLSLLLGSCCFCGCASSPPPHSSIPPPRPGPCRRFRPPGFPSSRAQGELRRPSLSLPCGGFAPRLLAPPPANGGASAGALVLACLLFVARPNPPGVFFLAAAIFQLELRKGSFGVQERIALSCFNPQPTSGCFSISAMEEVEVANRAAVESCHRVLALLSQSQQQDPALLKSIASETGEACAKFRKVTALLGNAVAAESRPLALVTLKDLLGSSSDTPPELMPSTAAAALSQSTSYAQLRARIGGAPDPRGLDWPARAARAALILLELRRWSSRWNVAHRYPFHQQPSRQKLQAEMFKRSNSGISLKFDSPSPSGGAGTMSSARSFMSSLSMDGSVASLDGKRPFHLIGAPVASDPADAHRAPKRRCTDDPAMLIVTYEGEHNHTRLPAQSAQP
ncbi:hypothetical protein HU200_005853 [Digitaria exilis]|uniref:WRKY domain-containing protein n=1 Tax=Digitaria exilis TaxID=1010633 RepID=A0A835KR55_9POAL|nr:hypothetical protein HU200_005853 [Digitaria exilis]